MAKIAKTKRIPKSKKKNNGKKIKSFEENLVGLFEHFRIRECKVILNPVLIRNINMKINKCSLRVNDKIVKPTTKKSNVMTYDLHFDVKLNELVQEQCIMIKQTAPKTIAQEADTEWRRIKRQEKEKKTTFDVNQFVLAKMKSYSPWPAQIRSFTKNGKRAQVFFMVQAILAVLIW